MSSIEKPLYTVTASEFEIEIRTYAPMLLAQIEEVGEREISIKNGFRALADYIFGANSSSEKIPMSAPVFQKKIGDNLWEIAFFIPPSYKIENLPTPQNKKIELKKIESKSFVAIRFFGAHEKDLLQKKENELKEFIKKKKLECLVDPIYAFFSRPSTPDSLRYNEILFEIRKKSAS